MIARVGVRVRGRGTGTLLTAYVFTHDRFSATMRVRIPAGVHLHRTHTPPSNIYFLSFLFLFSFPKCVPWRAQEWLRRAYVACSCERSMYMGHIWFNIIFTRGNWCISYQIVSYSADVRNSDDPCNYEGVPLCKFPDATDEESCKQGCCDIGPTCKYECFVCYFSLWNYYSPVLRSRQVACTHHTKHFWFTSLTHNTNTTTCQCNFVWNVCVSARRIEFWMNGMKIYWTDNKFKISTSRKRRSSHPLT